ncbi:MAG: MATE family efflux transporter [Saprospiraceae bacterium]|nr:MATE family efflux transporter [Saprospiraceae bacterium]MBK7797369.1 MATE family efflux transporter [Saprospiraceae bacterium]MBL0261538.1 MATE family efflux transporter [Saprospiraceae bacterium]
MKTFYHNAKKLIVLSLPIMLGSAGQNIIALTDSIFLYKYDEKDFAAVGVISVFYLVIASIAFGFSKGGQILMARKFGEKSNDFVKKYFYAIVFFELVIGILLFLILKFGARFILGFFIDSDLILEKSLEFLQFRVYGLVFAYVGLALVALYMAISRPAIIFIDTLILGIANLILCYGLVFGKLGLPEMGIAGAGLASALSEIIAFIFFAGYMALDKELLVFKLRKIPVIHMEWVRTIYKISIPILLQSVVGIGAWFLFFAMVEKLGEHELAISNLIRVVYLILSIPCWGYATAINTIVSKTIGRGRQRRVIQEVYHSSIVAFVTTFLISAPVLLFPEVLLHPFLGGEDLKIFQDSIFYFKLLLPIMLIYSVSTIFFNGVSGTGETRKGFYIQTLSTICYLIFVWFSIRNFATMGLPWAWGAEIIFWAVQLVLSWMVLRSGKWNFLKL